MHLFIGLDQARFTRGHQRTGGAGLHALAARHAGGIAHRIIDIEDDFCMFATEGKTNHVVHLLFAAGAHAARALNARIQIHRDAVVRQVGLRLMACLKARLAELKFTCPLIQFRIQRMTLFGHVGE